MVFVDEIDSTLKLGFTDDFFAAIRAAYNARSNDPAYERLTFVLLGVARPADLIKDRTRTPYNIGASVDVTDFQSYELDAFKAALDQACPGQGGQILGWALEWTGGQPYLTQKLCAEVVEQAGGKYSVERLAAVVTQLFLGDKARTETNLRSIRDRVSENPHAPKMLAIYKRVLAGKQVAAEERSIEQNELEVGRPGQGFVEGLLAGAQPHLRQCFRCRLGQGEYAGLHHPTRERDCFYRCCDSYWCSWVLLLPSAGTSC